MKTLLTIAPPQKRIETPMRTLVTIAGVEWNCMKVYKIIPEEKRENLLHFLGKFWKFPLLPVKNIGMDIKNPPIAHTRETLDFCKYRFSLKT